MTLLASREVITLYDLEQHLCQLLGVESYDRLQLGPLLRAPIIIQHFNPPASLLKVPKVSCPSTCDVPDCLSATPCLCCGACMHDLLPRQETKLTVQSVQIMYSNVVEAVRRLVTPKNLQVQPHAVLQWLTREFDVEMPQVFSTPHEASSVSTPSVSSVHAEHLQQVFAYPEDYHSYLQDLCVKVDSTEGIVQLVTEIQREEQLIANHIKQKTVKAAQQEAERKQVKYIIEPSCLVHSKYAIKTCIHWWSYHLC